MTDQDKALMERWFAVANSGRRMIGRGLSCSEARSNPVVWVDDDWLGDSDALIDDLAAYLNARAVLPTAEEPK